MAFNCKGFLSDIPDQRDFEYIPKLSLAALPSKVDLSALCPPVYNQGALGSCTAQALVGAHQSLQNKVRFPKFFMPSRLFLYYNERLALGTVNQDSGARLRDGIKSLIKHGIPDESLYPHVIRDFKKKPSSKVYGAALSNTIDGYYRVQENINSMKQALADGFPVAFGFTVYESFMSSAVRSSGIMPMPKSRESVQGGHAVLAVGYDDSKKMILVRNSWGSGFGIKGYFWMPYAYITPKLSRDYWVIKVL